MSNKQTIIFYKDWYQLIKNLSDTNKAKLLDLIFDENNSAEITDPHLKSVYDFIKYKIDENNQKYEAQIEKRKMAGIKSGEARRAKIEDEETQRTHVHFVQQKRTNTNLLYTDTVPDTEYCILNTDPDTVTDPKTDNKERKDYTPKPPNPKERKPSGFPTQTFTRDFKTLSDEHQKLTVEKYSAIRKTGIEHAKIVEWLENFDEFWHSYTPIRNNQGRCVWKGDKISCRIKYLRILWKGEPHLQIMEGLKSYLQFCKKGDQVTLAASTFLNQERWKQRYDDCVEADKRKSYKQPKVGVLCEWGEDEEEESTDMPSWLKGMKEVKNEN